MRIQKLIDLHTDNKPVSIVYKNSTLGYAFKRDNIYMMGVLNSNKHGLDWKDGGIYLKEDDFKHNLKLATHEDFDRLKVNDEGHLIIEDRLINLIKALKYKVVDMGECIGGEICAVIVHEIEQYYPDFSISKYIKEIQKGSIMQVKNSNISFKEVVKFNEDTQTGTYQVLINEEEFGVLTYTGHIMCPHEINITSSQALTKAMEDLILTANENKEIETASVIIRVTDDKKILFDEELVGILTDNKGFIINDIELLSYLLNELTSILK